MRCSCGSCNGPMGREGGGKKNCCDQWNKCVISVECQNTHNWLVKGKTHAVANYTAMVVIAMKQH